jgi:hypothetical protein
MLSAFHDMHPEEGGLRLLARWIDRNLPYSSAQFYPHYWAFNIQWHKKPELRIDGLRSLRGGGWRT